MSAPQPVGKNYSSWWGGEVGVDEKGNETRESLACRDASATTSSGSLTGVKTAALASTSGKPGETNAQRTLTRSPAGYAEAGMTPSGESIYVAGAAIKGRDPSSGI